jgi:diguanylate cyclase (GGDEF)-like protein
VSPVVASNDVLALTSAAFYLTGGLFELLATKLGLSSGSGSSSSPGAQGLSEFSYPIGLAAAVTGVTLFVIGKNLPRWVYHVLINLAGMTVVILLATSPGPIWDVTFWCYAIFVTIDAFLFFPIVFAGLYSSCWLIMNSAVLAGRGLIPELAVLDSTAIVLGGFTAWLMHKATQAETDPLTGLPNRLGIARTLEEHLQRQNRTPGPLALAMIDIDGFKQVNETRGAAAGDRTLRECAFNWAPVAPKGTTLGRHTADEFILILPGFTADQARAVVERLRERTPDGITCSAGIASWEAKDSVSMLVSRVDALLYQAKRAGRDRVAVHDDHQGAADELLTAMDTGQMRVAYQPIVSIVDGSLIGVEALARWEHPERGSVPPSEFIPLAERSHLISRLDQWMLHHACADAARWLRAGTLDKVSVNVCTQDLLDPDFADRVLDTMAETGLPPQHLILEITEGALETELPDTLRALERLRSFGVRVAIDDFGTGFSSLSRLDQLPVDILKVDRSFVSSIPEDADGAPLVGGVIALGHALGLAVIAEGVETEHQRALLTDLGCLEAQGYLFGRPVPAHLIGAPTSTASSRPSPPLS